MYINKISIKTSNRSKNMAQKSKSIKNHNKKHYRKILHRELSFYMSIIVSSFSSLRNFGPSIKICVSRSILISLRHAREGDTRRFMTEKPHSTPEIGGGISNANL